MQYSCMFKCDKISSTPYTVNLKPSVTRLVIKGEINLNKRMYTNKRKFYWRLIRDITARKILSLPQCIKCVKIPWGQNLQPLSTLSASVSQRFKLATSHLLSRDNTQNSRKMFLDADPFPSWKLTNLHRHLMEKCGNGKRIRDKGNFS